MLLARKVYGYYPASYRSTPIFTLTPVTFGRTPLLVERDAHKGALKRVREASWGVGVFRKGEPSVGKINPVAFKGKNVYFLPDK